MIGSINLLIWNCCGVEKRNFGAFIRDLRMSYHFTILVLLETKISGFKADKVVRNIGFDGSFRVDTDGYVGAIWVLWDSSI